MEHMRLDERDKPMLLQKWLNGVQKPNTYSQLGPVDVDISNRSK